MANVEFFNYCLLVLVEGLGIENRKPSLARIEPIIVLNQEEDILFKRKASNLVTKVRDAQGLCCWYVSVASNEQRKYVTMLGHHISNFNVSYVDHFEFYI